MEDNVGFPVPKRIGTKLGLWVVKIPPLVSGVAEDFLYATISNTDPPGVKGIPPHVLIFSFCFVKVKCWESSFEGLGYCEYVLLPKCPQVAEFFC